MIVPRAECDDLQHVPTSIAHDAGCLVIAEQPPPGRARCECPVLHQLAIDPRRIFTHGNVVDEHFARIEQAEPEFVKAENIRRENRRARSRGERIILPRSARGFIACSPRFRRGIVCIRIAQFERRAAAIGELRPRLSIAISHFIHDVAERIL